MAKTVAGKISGVLNRKSFFSTLNVYCMKLRGPDQKLFIDFKRHFIHN